MHYDPESIVSQLGLLVFQAGQFIVVRSGPVPCGMFSSTAGLYSLDARSIFPQFVTEMFSDTVKCPVGQNLPQLRTTTLDPGLPLWLSW